MTVRHASTDFNHQRRYAGLIDVPLSDEGVDDTKAAARGLSITADVVISSPLQRAMQTARILVGDTREIIPLALCNERDYGTMQGLTADEVEHLRPFINYAKIGGDFHSLNPPQGETIPALRKRARGFVEHAMDEFAGQRVLVVSHEVFLLQVHGILRGETWREAMSHRLPNLTLTTFTLQGGHLLSASSEPLVSRAQEDGSAFSFPSKLGNDRSRQVVCRSSRTLE